MHKVVELPEGIKVKLVSEIGLAKKPIITASIESDLRVNTKRSGSKSADIWNAAVDGVLNMILACACAGIDIEKPSFSDAVQTALDAIGNEYGE